jgi:NAD-dependent dihydropyrimidine dehydrogenase PreA subunit
VGDGQIFLGGIKMLRYLENVVTLQLDTETCNGCGMCVNVCPHGVFNVQDRKAAIVDKEACMECGACALNCPVNAIKVQSGVGCATAIIMGAIGKKSECSGSCGGSPAANSATKRGSCGTTK